MSFYQSHIASLLTPIATRTVVHQIISLLSALTITPNYPAKTNSVRITQIDTVCPNPVIVGCGQQLRRVVGGAVGDGVAAGWGGGGGWRG